MGEILKSQYLKNCPAQGSEIFTVAAEYLVLNMCQIKFQSKLIASDLQWILYTQYFPFLLNCCCSSNIHNNMRSVLYACYFLQDTIGNCQLVWLFMWKSITLKKIIFGLYDKNYKCDVFLMLSLKTTAGLYTNNCLVVVIVVVVYLAYGTLYRPQFLTDLFYFWYVAYHGVWQRSYWFLTLKVKGQGR